MINDACRKSTHKILFFLILFFFLPGLQGALYPYGIGNGDTQLDFPKWESGSEQISLDTSIPLLGDGQLSSVWVNTFGSLTYRQLIDQKLDNLLDNIAVAPFFIRSTNSSMGEIYYRQTTTDKLLLTIVADDVSSSLVLPATNDEIDTLDYRPTYALVVTWRNVASDKDPTLLNTFQIVLTTDGTSSFAIFNYDNTLSWGTSSTGKHAAAGIFVSPSVEKSCSYSLPKSETSDIPAIAGAYGNNGILGRFIVIISEPLSCAKYQTACEDALPSSDWGSSETFFSITKTSWDVYSVHTCNIGFEIRPGVNSERIDCVYEPDYYTNVWVKAPENCLDFNKTKKYDIKFEITNNSVVWIDELKDQKDYEDIIGEVEKVITRIVNLTDVIITVTNITSETRKPEERIVTETTLEVEVEVYIPPYLYKTLTTDNITDTITTTLEENEEIDGITFIPVVTVTDLTDTCLQGCMCRFRKGPKKCPKGKNPLIKPDSCCGGCNGKPYSSTIKACCNNEHVYDPTKAKCCNGRVRKGATGKCP